MTVVIMDPANPACADNYNNTLNSFTYCRIVINYETHIQPIWEKVRPSGGSCITCHTSLGDTQAASGQLELTNNASDLNAAHYTSYQELLRNDNEREADGSEKMIIPPSMSVNGALASNKFMELMTGLDLNNDGNQPTDTGDVHSHFINSQNADLQDALTASELKLISEWLDIGAQYYNDPTTAP